MYVTSIFFAYTAVPTLEHAIRAADLPSISDHHQQGNAMSITYAWDTKWQSFLKSEVEHHPPEITNDLCHLVDPLIHYERSLRTVAGRHSMLRAEFSVLDPIVSAFLQRSYPRTASVQEKISIARHGDLTALIHLEIETFYLFSKILLDRIAMAIEQWFGTVRGIPIGSHSKLTKNFFRYAATTLIESPTDFTEMLGAVERQISHFRDYQITHEQGRRTLRGTFYGNGQEPRIAMSPAHPLSRNSEDGSARSENINFLISIVNDYIGRVTHIFSANRPRARIFGRCN